MYWGNDSCGYIDEVEMEDKLLLTELTETINKILEDDPQLELQVNRGHWERILPMIIAKAEPLIRKEERERIIQRLRDLLNVTQSRDKYNGVRDSIKVIQALKEGKL